MSLDIKDEVVLLQQRAGDLLDEMMEDEVAGKTEEKLVDEFKIKDWKPRGDESEEKKEKKERMFGGVKHIVIDTFGGEIEILGDETDWKFERFDNFDVVGSNPPFDHYFYHSGCLQETPSAVKKEWEALWSRFHRKAQEDAIFIRAYSAKSNLMRAAITGLDGSPFCHGLFFFDILFPSTYPEQPPTFFYHSYGRELVPELRKDGYVSLKFAYRHHKDNIFQLLLYIQHALLNPMYYPNGLSFKQKFVLSCEMMLDTLKRPLSGFEDFVKGHFRRKANAILLRFKEAMDMKDESSKDLFFRLYKALEGNKAYCKHLLNEELRKEMKARKEKEEEGFVSHLMLPISTG